MEEEYKSLALVSFYFGENAQKIHSGVSPRLLSWGKAFEAWVEQQARANRNQVSSCYHSWWRLVRHLEKMPWEVTPADIAGHIRQMQQQGYQKSTINNELRHISSFYQWCAVNQVDELCAPAFNPTWGVSRPRRANFEGTSMWSREEINQLLELVGRDESVLGKREKAFFLLRLNSGVSLSKLINLRWEQIEQRGDDAWVSWSERFPPTRLPGEVWAAMKDYLVASGRLEGMQPGKLIFASSNLGVHQLTGPIALHWSEDRPMLGKSMDRNLRVYGTRLGISMDKLNLNALRRTSLRLRLDQGESLERMKQFMDSYEDKRLTKFRLKKVPHLSPDSGKMMPQVDLPSRQPYQFKRHEAIKHGLYTQEIDMQAVQQVMQEGFANLDEEIKCLRTLMECLVSLGMSELVTCDAYTVAVGRLGELVAFKSAATLSVDKEYAAWLRQWDEQHASDSRFPSSEQLKAAANQGYAGVNIQQEMARLRLILRDVYRRAEACQGQQEFVRLVNIYGKGCIRLMRVLQRKNDERSIVQGYVEDMLDQAIRELREEWGIDP